MTQPIYFDYAASTPVDERVVTAMLPYFTRVYGNPNSHHFFGQQAENALEDSRRKVAALLNCQPGEVIFTGCGTESDNLALRGAAFACREQNGARHIIVSPVEHHAVLDTARHLAKHHGFELSLLPVDENGMVKPSDVEAALRPDTALVSVVYANNEIGSINPIAEIGALCRYHHVPFHTDAVQASAHLPLDVQADQVDLMAMGAHKFYGPKGVGVLFIRNGTPLLSEITGGKQEFALRAGTQNIPYIVGLAEALSLVRSDLEERNARLSTLRDMLIHHVLKTIPRSRLTGHPVHRLPNHASFVFRSVNANQLLMLLDQAGFACASGAACRTGSPKPSEILHAIGIPETWSLGSLRITLGKETTREQVEMLADALPPIVSRARSISG